MAKKAKQVLKSVVPSGRAAAGVDLSVVERMLDFMNQHGLEEFEYEHAGLRVRLRKPSTNSHFGSPRPMALPEIVVAGPSSLAAPSALPPREETLEAARGEDLHLVKSPIVGTFYEAPSPGSQPFVKVGDQVSSGQVLCIIEAMKLMNEIESDAAGEVVRIYVENGQPVEYGESLFAIRPARKK
jgi:acetyl-CoA carboxylase biotin carboxyl carrier protein